MSNFPEFLVGITVRSGGLIPLMGLLFLITLTVIIERLYFFGKVLRAGTAMEHDVQLVRYQNVNELTAVAYHYHRSIQSAILKTAIASRGENAETMDRQIEENILWLLPKFDKHLWIIDTAVTLAPLMGLFGTIIGMIDSFKVLGNSGSGNPNAVTAGIADALIATGCGLLIAIVAIVFLNYFNKRIRLAVHQMELLKLMIINRLHGGGSEHYGVALADTVSQDEAEFNSRASTRARARR
jgi:biopolymer transport protein ExbB